MTIENGGHGTQLGALPDFAPDPGLRSRVMAARQRQLRVRRWQRSGGAAAVAAAGAALAVLAFWRPAAPPAAADLVQAEVASSQRESRALETQWQQLARGDAAGNPALMRLRLIDASLQAAYDRGAGTHELAPLWQQRNRALRGLITRLHGAEAGDGSAVTRI